MKSSVSIALIVCGALLVLAPFLFNLAAMHLVAGVMKSSAGNAHLSSALDDSMQWAACVAGLMMVLMGTAGALKSKSPG